MPRLLDLFCGQGGATVGYRMAGFDVTGVDCEPQPNYPGEFIQADALDFLIGFGRHFDAVHASPPCPGYTLLRHAMKTRRAHPLLIDVTRAALQQNRRPWVIENVVGAPLLDPITLCGEMFGLGVIRHRLFESSVRLAAPVHVKHRGRVRGWRHGEYFDGPYVALHGDGGGKASLAEGSEAMRINWMDIEGLRQAIPPAYTLWVGTQLGKVTREDSDTRTG